MSGELSHQDLERALVEIGARLEAPTVDLVHAVGRRIRSAGPAPARVIRFRRPVVSRRPSRPFGLTWRSVAAAAAAVVVLVTGILTFSPSARRAVAGWLGLRGVRIEVTPTPPTPPARPLGEGLDIGRRVTLAEAAEQAGFRVLVPARLGSPDAVHLHALFLGDEVFLVYRPGPGLPETSTTGVGALVSEFRGEVNVDYFKKVGAADQVEFVMVGGEPGYWIRGPHEVGYLDPAGNFLVDTVRLAGNVLVWERGDLTLRLESSLTRDEALRIARSFG